MKKYLFGGNRAAATLGTLMMVAAVSTVVSCESDDDELDHDPPAGQGSILVDNNSSVDIAVYLDGNRANDTGDWDVGTYDLDPGVYRVVLDGEDDAGSFAGDIDVLEGRLTILDVNADSSGQFDVLIYFD